MAKTLRPDPQVVSITTAPESAADELSRRQRRYLASMALRTVCFVGAIAVGQGVLRYVLIAGALVLPYIAVVMANAVALRLPGSDPERPVPGPADEAQMLPGADGRTG